MSERFERPDPRGSNLPERLRASGGTDLERRVLAAAAREEPSRALSERMAAGIGISPPPLAPPEQAPPDLGTIAPQAASGFRALLPWISGAVVVAVVGTIVATRPDNASPSLSGSTSLAAQAPTQAASSIAVPPEVPRSGTSEEPRAEPPRAATDDVPETAASTLLQRRRPARAAADIQDQIALIDGARAAVAAGASDRALALLRKYQDKYPAGSFHPESAALKIEALTKLGRRAEARVLAEKFVAEQGRGALADRVARLAGIERP